MDLERIHGIVREAMVHRSSHPWKEPGNKFYHGERTAVLACRLYEALFPAEPFDRDVLTAAAWLHDLRNGEEHHEELGAQDARRLLEPCCTSEELSDIARIILRHDDRSSPRCEFSREELVHQDADLLDHFGCYDIWMDFLYSGYRRETPGDAVRNVRSNHKRVLDYWSERLNYALSVRIFHEKMDYIASFFDRFALELEGGVADWDELLRTTPDLIGDRARGCGLSREGSGL